MNQEMKIELRKLLIKHEGYRLKPYKDTMGNLTIGIGRNLDGRGILTGEVDLMFENDTDYFYNFLTNEYEWFNDLSDTRKIALVDMCFMGTSKFKEFKRMIQALENHDYHKAANELLESKYSVQVGGRAKHLAEILRTGVII